MKDEYSLAARKVGHAARKMGTDMERAHNIAKHPVRHAVGKSLGSAWDSLKGVFSSFSGKDEGGSSSSGEGEKKTSWIQKIVGFLGNATRGLIAVLKPLATAFAGASVALVGFGFAASQVAAEQEALRMSLIAIAGSAEKADEQIRRLREVAKLPGLGFEEAIRGSARLQSVGFDARLAERAMMAFGNALALSGSGKAELDGVLLALQQIASKGKVSAEEILQIAERVPQIRKAMQAAFGTADTEALQQMGITAQEFIPAIIDELSKLPKVTGGMKNAFENLSDSIRIAMGTIGKVINDTFAPAVETFGKFISYVSDSGILAWITQEFIKAGAAAANATAAALKAGVKGAEGVGRSINNLVFFAPIEDISKFASKGIDFVMKAKDAGDFLIRAGSVLLGVFTVMPKIAKHLFDYMTVTFDSIRSSIEHWMKRLESFSIGPWKPFRKMSDEEKDARERQLVQEVLNRKRAEKGLENALNGALGVGQSVYDAFTQAKDPELPDGGLGTLNVNSARTAKATESLLQLEKRKADLADRILGGGQVGGQALNKVNLSRYQRGSGPVSRSASEIERLIRRVVDAIAENKVSGIVDSRRLNWGR